MLNDERNAVVGEQINLSIPEAADHYGFTPREIEILLFIIKGHTSKEIGQKLNLSFRTVENYTDRIKLKARCKRKSQLIFMFSKSID